MPSLKTYLILVLCVIIVLLVSTNHNLPVKNIFKSIDSFLKENHHGGKITFKYDTQFIPNDLVFSSPVTLKLNLSKKSLFKIGEDKEIEVIKGEVTLYNFTGTLKIVNSSLSGEVERLSSENIIFKNEVKISSKNLILNFIEIQNANLGEILLGKGTLKVRSPVNLTTTIRENIIFYQFSGVIRIGKKTKLEGKCNKIISSHLEIK